MSDRSLLLWTRGHLFHTRFATAHPERVQKRNSLRSRADFANTTRNGQRVTRPAFVLYHLDRAAPDSPAPRVGFAVGRRLGGAVVRNRIRRRLREAVRPVIGRLPPCDLVVVARPGAVGAGVAELENALGEALAEAGLLRTDGSRHNRHTQPDA